MFVNRSALGLVGNHIDVWSGTWKYLDSGIGPNQDSFYEYLLKAYVLFGDFEYLYMFEDFYRTIAAYMKKQDWYVDVHMANGHVSLPWFTSLGAFWPGVQVSVSVCFHCVCARSVREVSARSAIALSAI